MQIIFTRSNAVNPDPRVEKEIKTLVSSNYKVQVLGWNRSGESDSLAMLEISNHRVKIKRYSGKASFGGGIKNLKELFLFQFFLVKELLKSRNSIDLIHAADFDTIIPAFLMRIFFKKKVIYDVYDFYVDSFSVPRKLKPLIRKIDLFIMSSVDAVIITNESRLDQIQGSTPKRIEVIHNTPAEDVLEHIKASRKSMEYRQHYQVTVAYVGILQDSRLLLEVVDVFKGNPNWQLIVAGFGKYEKYFEDVAREFSNIQFLGKVSYEQSLSISYSADLLFATYDPKIPNHRYSSPNKFYEAMMLGKPIIVCTGTGIDSLVLEQEVGWAIEYSANAFETAVNKFLLNKDYVLKIQKKMMFLYRTKYSWEIMSDRLLTLYHEILT